MARKLIRPAPTAEVSNFIGLLFDAPVSGRLRDFDRTSQSRVQGPLVIPLPFLGRHWDSPDLQKFQKRT